MRKRDILNYYLSRAPRAIKQIMAAKPALFRSASLGEIAPAPESTSEITSWLNQISQTAQQLLPVYQQQQIFDANIELAKQGKPLISAAQLAPQFQVGLSNTTLLALAGVLGLYLFSRR